MAQVWRSASVREQRYEQLGIGHRTVVADERGRSRFALAANHRAVRSGERDQVADPPSRLLADNGAEPAQTDCSVAGNELDPNPDRLGPERAYGVEFALGNMHVPCPGFAGQAVDSLLAEQLAVIVDLCLFLDVEHAVIAG